MCSQSLEFDLQPKGMRIEESYHDFEPTGMRIVTSQASAIANVAGAGVMLPGALNQLAEQPAFKVPAYRPQLREGLSTRLITFIAAIASHAAAIRTVVHEGTAVMARGSASLCSEEFIVLA